MKGEQDRSAAMREVLKRLQAQMRDKTRRLTEMVEANGRLEHEVAERERAEALLQAREQKLRRQNEVLMRLARGDALASGDLTRAFKEILPASAKVVDVESISVWEFSPDRDAIDCLARFERTAENWSRGERVVATDFPSYFSAIQKDYAIVAHDAHRDPRTRELSGAYLIKHGVGSLLDSPIRLRGEVAGVFCIEHVGPPRRWTAEDEHFAGAMADLLSLAFEIRERRRTEETLQASEARLRQVIDLVPHFIFAKNRDGRFVLVNKAVADVYGTSVEALTGALESDVNPHAEEVKRFRRDDLEVLALGEPKHIPVETIVDSRGEVRYLQTVKIPYKSSDSDEAAVLGVASDITERMRAEEALRESRRTLSTLLSNLIGMAYRCRNDWNWTMEFVSEGAYDLTGHRPEAFIGNTRVAYNEIIDVDDQEHVWDTVQRALADRRPYELVYRIHTAQGQRRWVWEKGSGVFDAEGKLLALEGFITDITARKRAEDAQVDLAARLEKQAQALLAANDELRRRNEELDEFAHIVSHDLKAPLRRVRTFADLLRSECAAALPPTGAEYLDRLDHAAERMEGLITELLAYARIARLEDAVETVDLGALARDVVSDLEPRIREIGARIEIGPLPTVRAVPRQMRQLFENLLDNALKFRRRDVSPEIHLSGGRLDAGASPIGAACRVTISDNGIGFEPSDAERIFGIFKRLSGGEEYEGTGIGLALARKIVERHGGRIEAEGRPGEGAAFVVTLPA
ncbi:MAG: PAS domain S-box protein [Myxococcales bacterium]|nr:PAS domain S-box protein [Myxococcales bacterium]